MSEMRFDDGNQVEFRQGDRITLEELEQRFNKSHEASRTALVSLAEYLDSKVPKDNMGLEHLRVLTRLVGDEITAKTDFIAYRSHIKTIEKLLTDPILKMQRPSIEKHRGKMHWVFLAGTEVPLPVMLTNIENLEAPSAAALEIQRAARRIVEEQEQQDE